MKDRTMSIEVLSEQIDRQAEKLDNIKTKSVVDLNEYQMEKILLEGLINSWVQLIHEGR